MASQSYSHALPHLLITLRETPDRIDDPIIEATSRFLELHSADASNISTAAAAQAPELGRLVMRAYTQASGSPERATALDLVDGLQLSGAYDMTRLVGV